MRRISWSTPAHDDLIRIERWLDEESESARTLETFFEIRRRCDLLHDLPAGGSPIEGDRRKFRVPGTPYLIIYRVEAQRVVVIRVVHQRENYQIDL